jgi:hypothetical protein
VAEQSDPKTCPVRTALAPSRLHFDFLLFPSTFDRHYMALTAGAVEFVVLSGRPVEAVAGLAQHCQLHAWLSLVRDRHRLGRVRASTNRRDFHFGNLAHGSADGFSDLAESVQVFEDDRYLLHLSRLAQCGKGGTGEQLAQRLPLFRTRAGIDIVSNEASLDRLAYDLLSELASEPKLHAVQLHITVSSVDNLPQREELALPMSRRFAEDARTTNAAAVRTDHLTLKGPGRFLGRARRGLYHPQCRRNEGQDRF